MRVTEKELAEIRRELEQQERELSVLETAARAHADVQMHLAEELREQLADVGDRLAPRPKQPLMTFFARV